MPVLNRLGDLCCCRPSQRRKGFGTLTSCAVGPPQLTMLVIPCDDSEVAPSAVTTTESPKMVGSRGRMFRRSETRTVSRAVRGAGRCRHSIASVVPMSLGVD